MQKDSTPINDREKMNGTSALRISEERPREKEQEKGKEEWEERMAEKQKELWEEEKERGREKVEEYSVKRVRSKG
jgi:hypothetical protein